MPLLSVEFALFFIVFLPIYWGFAKYPSVQNLLLLAAGMGWLYHISPVFAAIIVLYSSACTFWANCSVPIAKVRAAFGWGAALPPRLPFWAFSNISIFSVR